MKSNKKILLIIALSYIIGIAIIAICLGKWNSKQFNPGEVAKSEIFGFYVGSKGEISSNNSTSTPLAANDTFVGLADQLHRMTEVTVLYSADQPSATNGLRFEWSTDGTNWQYITQATAVENSSFAAGYGGVHSFPRVAQYFRILYINGDSAQTSFDLETIYHHEKNMPLIGQSDQIVNRNSDVQYIRQLNSEDYDVNTGLVRFKMDRHKFGSNIDVGASEETIWTGGGLFVYPDTADYIRVAAGGDPGDSITAAGAHRIEVTFLDSLWVEQIDTLTLRGALVSDSTFTKGIRLQTSRVIDVGTYGAFNIDDITIELAGTNEIIGIIADDEGRTNQTMYSVPAGWDAYIRRATISVSHNNSANMRLITRERGNDVTSSFGAWNQRQFFSDVEGPIPEPLKSWIFIPAYSDIEWRAIKDIGGSNPSVSIDYDLLLVKKE